MSTRDPQFKDPRFKDAEVQIELQPDGTVRFEVSGVPGEGCEALERMLVEALGGEVTSRERTAQFYQQAAAYQQATAHQQTDASTGMADRLKAWLRRS